MNREILFRGKCIEEAWIADVGDWVYGGYMPPASKYFNKHLIGNAGDCAEVDPETVGQFTGICDKNGTKIFEGDIIKALYRSEQGVIIYKVPDCTYFIKTESGCFRLYNFAEVAVVIGNIHDNPELLEEKQR